MQEFSDKKAREYRLMLYELSKPLLGRYLNSAAGSRTRVARKMPGDGRLGSPEDQHTLSKRARGMHTAVNKLVNS